MWSLCNRPTAFSSFHNCSRQRNPQLYSSQFDTRHFAKLCSAFQHISQFSTDRFAPLSLILCCREIKNVFLFLLGTAGKVKLLEAPLHQIVSLIFCCCLLSLLWLINLHTVRTQSVAFCYCFSTVSPAHKSISYTFLLYLHNWPKQWHYWRQVHSLQFSRHVGSFCCVFSGAP
jgi:hypothetical protein